MYQLYCARNTYAMGAHVLLEELGVKYQLKEVTLYSDTHDSDFSEASPHGRVPALRHEHGTIFESGAIAQYLADTHDDQRFGVALDDPLRASYLQWMYYLSSTVQPEVLIQFHPDHYFSRQQDQHQLKIASMKRLSGVWQIVNAAYSRGPWLIDNRPTAVDFCLAIQIQWQECFENNINDYPNLATMLETISARPAFKKVMQWHMNESK